MRKSLDGAKKYGILEVKTGFRMFRLKNDPMPKTWSKAELTVNVKGTTVTFTSVPLGDDYNGQHNSDVTVS